MTILLPVIPLSTDGTRNVVVANARNTLKKDSVRFRPLGWCSSISVELSLIFTVAGGRARRPDPGALDPIAKDRAKQRRLVGRFSAAARVFTLTWI